ncbi:twitching motility protein PilT, partial [Candidatus Peregrinibacteria bacterium]|nr:twitching motility protein PilT [Candidatus Peregrinibacteria bacterium]
MLEADFKKLLVEVIDSGSPDLHLQVGQCPVVRMRNGSISSVDKYPVVTKEDLTDVIGFIMNDEQRTRF